MTMPTPLLNAYADELPRLSAEESLQAAERTAVGTGSLKKGVGRRISDGWAKRAGHRAPAIRPTTKAMHAAQMRALGIGVKTEPKAPDG